MPGDMQLSLEVYYLVTFRKGALVALGPINLAGLSLPSADQRLPGDPQTGTLSGPRPDETLKEGVVSVARKPVLAPEPTPEPHTVGTSSWGQTQASPM